MINDDKVGPRGVKVRCKKCGHLIVVRPEGREAVEEDAPGAAGASAPPVAAEDASGAPAPGRALTPVPGVLGVSKPAELASIGTPPEGGLLGGVEEEEIGAVFDAVLNHGAGPSSTGGAGQGEAGGAARPVTGSAATARPTWVARRHPWS